MESKKKGFMKKQKNAVQPVQATEKHEEILSVDEILKSNIYQKIQVVRVKLQNMNLKKSGLNDYSKYDYFELSDFLPQINILNAKYGLFTKFNLHQDYAELEIYNANNPDEFVTFVSPVAEVEIGKKKDGTGGAEPIQNLGGKMTYLRRYLFMTAYEIVESDLLERINKAQAQKQQKVVVNKKLDLKVIEEMDKINDLEKLTQYCHNYLKKNGPEYKFNLTQEFKRLRSKLEQDQVEPGQEVITEKESEPEPDPVADKPVDSEKEVQDVER